MSILEDRLGILSAEFQRLDEKGIRSANQMITLVGELRVELNELVRQRKELASLYEVAQDLSLTPDLSELLDSIVGKATLLVGAERGFLVLADPPGEDHIAAARRFAQNETSDDAFSTSLVNRVMESRKPILTTNVQNDGRFELTQSIIVQDIRSVLAVPLIARGELQGAIYVDTRMSVHPFGNGDLGLLQAMASQAAMAIRSARLYEDARESNQQLTCTLAELRETQEQLVQAERLAAVGRLATSVAHELRSPLMVMRSALYFLNRVVSLDEPDTPDILRRYFAKLDSEIDRQAKIINDLLFFSRNRPRSLTGVDLNAILTETLIRVRMPESIVVRQELDPDLAELLGDADQLQQVFVNLIANAVQAMPEGGSLTLRTRPDGCFAVAEVTDSGVGIAEENIGRIFEPFFTTREKGIGLGLAVSKSLVEGHNGSIEVDSTHGLGTTFTVRLPFELIG